MNLNFNRLFFCALMCAATGPLSAGAAVDALRSAAVSGETAAAIPPDVQLPAALALTESRGVWVDKSDLYKGKEYLLAALDQLKAANLNTLYLPIWHKGWVTYPGSAYAPADPDMAKVDVKLMSWLIDEAHKRGFMVQAWTEYGFGTYHTPNALTDPSRGAILDKRPELTSVDKDGRPYEHIPEWGYFYSMCPVNQASQDIVIALFTEALKVLPFDALNLDRMRFANANFCFCDHCKKKFREDTGYELDSSIFDDPERLASWRAWRKAQVTAFVGRLRAAVKDARPGMPVTAAVWYDTELDNMGQDWPAWLRKGYLDFAVPMVYWSGNDATVDGSAGLAPARGKVGVGISAADCPKEEVARQVRHARAKKMGGVAFWYLNPLLGMADYLKAEVFPTPAQPYAGTRAAKVK